MHTQVSQLIHSLCFHWWGSYVSQNPENSWGKFVYFAIGTVIWEITHSKRHNEPDLITKP